jgi:hypothetical protein
LLDVRRACGRLKLSRPPRALGLAKGRAGIVDSVSQQLFMAWKKYLSPRKFMDASPAHVEALLAPLADRGKAGWQIEQAEGGFVVGSPGNVSG